MGQPFGREYIKQLLLTATNGNVTIEYGLHTARMQLYCHKCDITLTAPEMEDATSIDFAVQEFIKNHAHRVVPAETSENFGSSQLAPESTVPNHVHNWRWTGEAGIFRCACGSVAGGLPPSSVSLDFKPVGVKKSERPLTRATGRKFR